MRLFGRGEARGCGAAGGQRVVVSGAADRLRREEPLCALECRASVFITGARFRDSSARPSQLRWPGAGDELGDVGVLRFGVGLGGAQLVFEGARIERGHHRPGGHCLPLLELHGLQSPGDPESELHLADVDVAVQRENVRRTAPRAATEQREDAGDERERDDGQNADPQRAGRFCRRGTGVLGLTGFDRARPRLSRRK
jgi:hypothetical protein